MPVLPSALDMNAGDIPQSCNVCGGMHFLRRTARLVQAARQCDECRTRHPAKPNEVWFESSSAGGWVKFRDCVGQLLLLGVHACSWECGLVGALHSHGCLPSRQELNRLSPCGSAPALAAARSLCLQASAAARSTCSAATRGWCTT